MPPPFLRSCCHHRLSDTQLFTLSAGGRSFQPIVFTRDTWSVTDVLCIFLRWLCPAVPSETKWLLFNKWNSLNQQVLNKSSLSETKQRGQLIARLGQYYYYTYVNMNVIIPGPDQQTFYDGRPSFSSPEIAQNSINQQLVCVCIQHYYASIMSSMCINTIKMCKICNNNNNKWKEIKGVEDTVRKRLSTTTWCVLAHVLR